MEGLCDGVMEEVCKKDAPSCLISTRCPKVLARMVFNISLGARINEFVEAFQFPHGIQPQAKMIENTRSSQDQYWSKSLLKIKYFSSGLQSMAYQGCFFLFCDSVRLVS